MIEAGLVRHISASISVYLRFKFATVAKFSAAPCLWSVYIMVINELLCECLMTMWVQSSEWLMVINQSVCKWRRGIVHLVNMNVSMYRVVYVTSIRCVWECGCDLLLLLSAMTRHRYIRIRVLRNTSDDNEVVVSSVLFCRSWMSYRCCRRCWMDYKSVWVLRERSFLHRLCGRGGGWILRRQTSGGSDTLISSE